MRAVVLTGHGGLDKLVYRTDYPDPEVGPQDVLIRVRATAINYHDIFSRRGMPGIRIPMPLITGSDVAGEIVSLGDAVSGWKVGDRVLVDPILRGRTRSGMIGETTNGGKAELLGVPHQQLICVPGSVSLEEAAALPLAYGTAHRMMTTIGHVVAGETVLILGASGGVGVACVQLAKRVGATVIACAGSAEKIGRLRELGADHCVDYGKTEFRSAVWDIVGKPKILGAGGVDVVVNFTGGDTWTPSLRCIKRGGRLLTCGATAGFEASTDLRFVWTYEQQILGSNGWTREDLTTLLELTRSGSMRPVIGLELPLAETAQAEQAMEERRVFGKVLVKP